MFGTTYTDISTLTQEERARYIAAWRRYKLFNWGWLASFLGLVSSLFLSSAFVRSHYAALRLLPMALLLLCLVAADSWSCPRCGNRFTGGLQVFPWNMHPLIRRCYSCQLAKRDLAALERGER